MQIDNSLIVIDAIFAVAALLAVSAAIFAVAALVADIITKLINRRRRNRRRGW